MTEISLSTAIFGENKEGALSDLFDKSSSTLPATPNNVNFPVTPTRQEKDPKKKKRKRKGDPDVSVDEKGTSGYTQDDSTSKRDKSESNDTVEGGVANLDDEEDRTIFVGNLPFDITRKKLESIFKSCGKIKSSRLRSFGTTGVKVAPEHAGNQNLVKKISVNTKQFLENASKNTAQGYVVFDSTDSVEKALKMNNKVVPNSDGLILRVDRAKPTLDSTRSVFIGNLPYKANELTLRSHFNESCGWNDDDNVIEGVRIVRDKESMECKGFGYILLKDKSYVPAALALHESTYMKRELRVLVCGKRFKNRKGAPKEGTNTKELKGAHRRVANKDKKSIISTAKDIISGTKEKKKRGTKKVGVKKANVGGISKRAASGKKLDKRVQKIQKRIQKGMGKTKK